MVREARPATRFWTRGEFGTTVVRWALLLAAIVVVLGALRVASLVAVPIALAIFFAMLFAPLHMLIARRAPRWLAAGVSGAALILALLLVAATVVWAAESAWREYQDNQEEYLAEYADSRQWLLDRGLPDRWLPTADDLRSASGGPADASPQGAEGRSLGDWYANLPSATRQRISSWVTGGVGSLLGGLVLLGFAVVMMVLLLWDLRRWQGEARDNLAERQDAHLRQWLEDSARSVRRYFWGKTLVGVVTGVLTGLWLWFMDVPIPLVWAVLSFFMCFIPNIGAFIAGAPPTLLALFTGGIADAAIVALGLVIIEGVLTNAMDPIVQGALLRLSPFMVVVALVFWAWMWGIPGAILSVPLMNIIILAIERVPRYEAERRADEGAGARLAPGAA